jgi:hypothetical protein
MLNHLRTRDVIQNLRVVYARGVVAAAFLDEMLSEPARKQNSSGEWVSAKGADAPDLVGGIPADAVRNAADGVRMSLAVMQAYSEEAEDTGDKICAWDGPVGRAQLRELTYRIFPPPPLIQGTGR